MQDYEYRDEGGRYLCRLHHRLRCDECHYVSELQEQNKRYREQLELIRKDTFYEEHEFVSVRHLIRKRVDKALKGERE